MLMINNKFNIKNLILSIKYPDFTKTIQQKQNNIYCFIIEKRLTKIEILNLFKIIFPFQILSINTLLLKKPNKMKKGCISYYKKVYIKIKR